MGGCMGQWVGSGQMTNLIKLELINIIWFCLKIYNLSRHPYLWVDGWVNGWAHVKPLKSNKSWPNRDNSIMDILDILLDILLKPPQPFIGLFCFSVDTVHVWVFKQLWVIFTHNRDVFYESAVFPTIGHQVKIISFEYLHTQSLSGLEKKHKSFLQ